jgi:hypothetical protein
MCTLESLIKSMMKLTLACNIISSTKTHSSNKKTMSPLSLRGDSMFYRIRTFLYKEGITQLVCLRIRGERYRRFYLQEGSDQRRVGRAVAQRLDACFPPRRSGFEYGQHVEFVVDKAALVQVFSDYFSFPCQSFHRFLHYHNHPGLTQ